MMAAKPGFAAVAILSLALGIGANTAIFSLWNGVLNSPLPGVSHPEQLALLTSPDDAGMWHGRTTHREDGDRTWLTYSEFEQLRDHETSFSSLMASQSALDTWEARVDSGGWEKSKGRFVSGGYFDTLGVHASVGRLFIPDDDRSANPNAVISYNYWQRRFAGGPVLGKTIELRKGSLTIIGVAAQGFRGETSGQNPDVWIPLRMQPALSSEDWLHDQTPQKIMWLQAFGRLKPGVTLAQAEAQSNTLFQAGLEAFYGPMPEEKRRDYLDQHLHVQSAGRGASYARVEYSNSLNTLLAAVGVLLLIACANLANLLLARGAARKSEIALRLSLGASRGRIIRQLVTESLALGFIGGAAGLAAAYFIYGGLVGMMAQSDRAFEMRFSLDPLVLAFAFASTVAGVLLFSLLPALEATRTGASLTEHSRGPSGSSREKRWGRSLVSLQLALSLPLLAGAGLLIRTLYNVEHIDLGFPKDHLLLLRVDSREAGYEGPRRDALHRELSRELALIPGVRSVSFSQLGIFSGGNSSDQVEVEGYTAKSDKDRGSALDVVGPHYFSTLGVPVVLGREGLESDVAGANRSCVINQAFAKRFFDGRNPIGMHVTDVDENVRTTYQIVGVARNERVFRGELRSEIRPRFFIAADQSDGQARSPTFLIRTTADTGAIALAARKTVENLHSALPIIGLDSLEKHMEPLTAQDRTIAGLAIAFACVALALAAIGLYGVLSYGVARRTSEIALRIAIGARPGRVISMILLETAGLVIAGLALGAGFAYTASRFIQSRLYGVAPQDPLTLSMATLLLLAVAFTAAYLPARRASRLDPMSALRQE
jgi:predicted permease